MADVLKAVAAARVLPVVVIDDARAAGPLGSALKRGGLSCAEITLRTPAAANALRDLAADPDMVVGADTVLNAPQAARVIDAGARRRSRRHHPRHLDRGARGRAAALRLRAGLRRRDDH